MPPPEFLSILKARIRCLVTCRKQATRALAHHTSRHTPCILAHAAPSALTTGLNAQLNTSKMHVSMQRRMASRSAGAGRTAVAVNATVLPPVSLSGRAATRRRHGALARRRCQAPEQEPATRTEDAPADADGAETSNSNGAEPAAPAPAPATNGDEEWDHKAWTLDAGALVPQARYEAPDAQERFWTSAKLALALPWRRFKSESVLAFTLEGEISDQLQGRFSPTLSLPALTEALEKAARDPRVVGIAVEIKPLAAGWAKLSELRRYLELFKESGKFSIAYSKLAGEKEYYLGSAFGRFYVPPSASVRLTGFSVSATFLRGVLDNVGVEPQIKRIGKYKSAGDQLLRRESSEPQREQLTALLDNIYTHWLDTVAAARGKGRGDVIALLESNAAYDPQRLLDGGWVDGLKYEDEVIAELRELTGGKDDEVRKVGIRKYASVSPTAFGLTGKKRVAVLRAGGAILGSAGRTGGGITPDALVPRLRALAKDKRVAAVVLRVDSPGGDALASDLMWREIKQLAQVKPVVACMGDVAASGGYYLSMAAQAIVASPLTVTGSIGVVTGKFNLGKLYERAGYTKELLSRGRYAELLAAEQRPFTDDEAAMFDEIGMYAYRSFRDKAASSRGMGVEAMEEVAQGRVWSGVDALPRGLVDALGGLPEAVAAAKQAANIPQDERVSVVEVTRARSSPLALLSGGGASVMAGGGGGGGALGALLGVGVALTALLEGGGAAAALQQALGAAALAAAGPNGLTLSAVSALADGAASGRPLALLADVDASTIGAAGGMATSSVAVSGGGGFLNMADGDGDDEGGAGAVWEQVESLLERVL